MFGYSKRAEPLGAGPFCSDMNNNSSNIECSLSLTEAELCVWMEHRLNVRINTVEEKSRNWVYVRYMIELATEFAKERSPVTNSIRTKGRVPAPPDTQTNCPCAARISPVTNSISP
jgi:hypothetical protein